MDTLTITNTGAADLPLLLRGGPDTGPLLATMRRTTNSYKHLFLRAILAAMPEEAGQLIAFERLYREMLAEAWWLHRPRVRWDTFDGLSKADGGAEMDDGERGGAAAAAPGRERRMTAARKRDAVLRLLQGEPLELAARELSVTAADLTAWRDAFLEAGEASLKSRPRDDRDERIERLQSKLGEVLMDNELLCTKVERLEGGVPLGPRRSRR